MTTSSLPVKGSAVFAVRGCCRMLGRYNLLTYVCFFLVLGSNGFCFKPVHLGMSRDTYNPWLDFDRSFYNKLFFHTDKNNGEEASPSSLEASKESDCWLAWDKFWHFSASFVTVGAGYHLCASRLGFKRPMATGISLSGAFGLGVGKELIDRYRHHRRFSWKDIIANALGITLGYFVFIH